MTIKIKIEGFRELEQALGELPKTTGRGVIRRVLKKRAQPIADAARHLAPEAEGDLRESIAVSTRLSKRQRKHHRKVHKKDIEVFVGAGKLPQAHLQEFGTRRHPPHSFLRPAWDAKKLGVLDGLQADLWTEIKKASERLARKAAKAKQ